MCGESSQALQADKQGIAGASICKWYTEQCSPTLYLGGSLIIHWYLSDYESQLTGYRRGSLAGLRTSGGRLSLVRPLLLQQRRCQLSLQAAWPA